MRILVLLCFFGALSAASDGQSTVPLHNFEVAGAAVFPLNGWRTFGYTSGAGWRTGYEFRPLRHLAADAGFTETWPAAIDTCSRFSPVCASSRQYLKLLDYGLRGIAPIAHGQVELSVGLGGGYV